MKLKTDQKRVVYKKYVICTRKLSLWDCWWLQQFWWRGRRHWWGNQRTCAWQTVRESAPRKKLVVKPHQKRKVVRSQTQAMSHLAGSLNQLVESHVKRHKEQMNFVKKTNKAFLELQKQEADKNPPAWDRDGEDRPWSSWINATGASKHIQLLLTKAISNHWCDPTLSTVLVIPTT